MGTIFQVAMFYSSTGDALESFLLQVLKPQFSTINQTLNALKQHCPFLIEK